MTMKRCPVCGEKYSDTYRSCPFCEEEEALRQGGQIRRGGGRGGKRAAGGQQPNLLSPILVVIIILLACLLLYLLFGDRIAEKLGGDKDPAPTPAPVEDVTPPPADDEQEPEGGVMPGDAEDEPSGGQPEDTPASTVDPANLPQALTVNNPDFTLKVGETYTVKVTAGSSGPFTWLSSDDGVVSVDAGGKVTAISVGKVTLTVHDGTGKGTVTVYVKPADNGATALAPTTQTTPSGGENKLNKTDFTLPVGDPDVQLTVSGVTTAVTWTSKDPGVATVSGSGVVKAVAKGTTTVTASWDGQSLECIVRVR